MRGRVIAEPEYYNEAYRSTKNNQVDHSQEDANDLRNEGIDREIGSPEEDINPPVDDVFDDRYLVNLAEHQSEYNQHTDNAIDGPSFYYKSPTLGREDLTSLRPVNVPGKFLSKGGPNPQERKGSSGPFQHSSAEGLRAQSSQRMYTGVTPKCCTEQVLPSREDKSNAQNQGVPTSSSSHDTVVNRPTQNGRQGTKSACSSSNQVASTTSGLRSTSEPTPSLDNCVITINDPSDYRVASRLQRYGPLNRQSAIYSNSANPTSSERTKSTTQAQGKHHKDLQVKPHASVKKFDLDMPWHSPSSLTKQFTGPMVLSNDQQEHFLLFEALSICHQDGGEELLVLGTGMVLLLAALYATRTGSWPDGAYVEYLISPRLLLNLIPILKDLPSSYIVQQMINMWYDVEPQLPQTGPGLSALKDTWVRVAFPNVARTAEQRLDGSDVIFRAKKPAPSTLPTPMSVERYCPFASSTECAQVFILPEYFSKLDRSSGSFIFTVVVYTDTYRMHGAPRNVCLTLLVDDRTAYNNPRLVRFATFGINCKEFRQINVVSEDIERLYHLIGGPQGIYEQRIEAAEC